MNRNREQSFDVQGGIYGLASWHDRIMLREATFNWKSFLVMCEAYDKEVFSLARNHFMIEYLYVCIFFQNAEV